MQQALLRYYGNATNSLLRYNGNALKDLTCHNTLRAMFADERFVIADSRNLPKVDVSMTGEYLNKSECYKVAEVQGVKAQR
jgi:hypothetical protein